MKIELDVSGDNEGTAPPNARQKRRRNPVTKKHRPPKRVNPTGDMVARLTARVAELEAQLEDWRPIVRPYLQVREAREKMRVAMKLRFPQYISEITFGAETLSLHVMVYNVPQNCCDQVSDDIYAIGDSIDADIMFMAMVKNHGVTAEYYQARVDALTAGKA